MITNNFDIFNTINESIDRSWFTDYNLGEIMVYQYKGHYTYTQKVIGDWNNNQIGVYYCGFIAQDGTLTPLYIGKAVGKEGIRGRLLQHLTNDIWPDVTHFGYCVCDTTQDADGFESSEIGKYKPKYNIQGKTYGY